MFDLVHVQCEGFFLISPSPQTRCLYNGGVV